MELASLRDLVLVIWGLVALVATIYLCIIVGILYKRINTLLLSMNIAALKIKEIADQAQEEVIVPLTRIGSFLRGITQSVSFITKLFNKKEKK